MLISYIISYLKSKWVIDTNSLLKDWNDYQINYNKSQIDKSTKIDFEDNNSIIEQPECSIIRNN